MNDFERAGLYRHHRERKRILNTTSLTEQYCLTRTALVAQHSRLITAHLLDSTFELQLIGEREVIIPNYY